MKIRNPFEDSDYFPELTSLIDVMFLLLVFFMLTTTFNEDTEVKTVPIELPYAEKARPLRENNTVTLGIDETGGYLLNDQSYTESQIYEEFEAWLKQSGDSTVIIRGDRKAPYHSIIYAYDMLQALGISAFAHQIK